MSRQFPWACNPLHLQTIGLSNSVQIDATRKAIQEFTRLGMNKMADMLQTAFPKHFLLTHLSLVPHICVSESGQHWFR